MIHIFDDYELDTYLYEIRRAGQHLRLEPKAFDVLVYLLLHRDRVVPKDELIENLWPEQFVSDAALNSSVMTARKAVGDNGRIQRVIQTLRGRGYRFIAEVEEHEGCEYDHTFGAASPFDEASVSGVAAPEETVAVETATDAPQEPEEPQALLPATSQACLRCITCQHDNNPTSMYCTECGTQLVHVCHKCTTRVTLPARFCLMCGQLLDTGATRGVLRRRNVRRPFVGRVHEMARLHSCLAEVRDGRGHVLELIGEAGVGVSRVLHEFRRSVAGQDVLYLPGRCDATRRHVPYGPVRDFLRASCGITAADSAETMTAKVYQWLQQTQVEYEDAAGYILMLLGVALPSERFAALPPELLHLRLSMVLRAMVVALSRQRPVVLIVEDIQWIDQTSEACLAALMASVPDVPLLVIVSRTPAYQPTWLADTRTTSIHVPRLTRETSLELVRHLVSRGALPAHVVETIVTQAQGHPLFLEELVRLYQETGGTGAEMALPATVEDSVWLRMEHLPPVPQRLLQLVAVVGMVVPLRLLQQVWDEPQNLERGLRELERRGWCAQRGDATEPLIVLTHGCVQQQVYESMLPTRLQGLHAAVGQALETLYAGNLEQALERVAYHYAASNQTEKAVEYLIRAATKTMRWGAYPEAMATLQDALTRVERLPAGIRTPYRLDIALQYAAALFAQGRLEETDILLQRQLPCVEEQGDAQLQGRYALLASQTYGQRGAWLAAAQQAQQAIECALACQDEQTLGRAYQVLAMAQYWLGDARAGVESSQQALTRFEHPSERARQGMTLFILGLNALLLGEFDEALEAVTQTQGVGHALGHPHLQTFAAWATGWIQATRGEWDTGVRACQLALEWAPDPLSSALAQGWLGYAYLEKGELDEAVPCLEDAIRQIHDFDYQRMLGLYTIFLGETRLAQGNVEDASPLVEHGLDMAVAADYHFGAGWAQRAVGRIALQCGRLEEAQASLTQAVHIFHALQARFEAARTQLTLAEVTVGLGDRGRAAAHVSRAHTAFTDLHVPVYIHRVKQLADDLGLPWTSA